MRTVAAVYDRRKSLFWTSPAVIDRRYSCLGLLLMLLSSSVASAQRQFTLSVDTQLVVETVTVRDKDGKAIEGLRADDFVVTEDGAPQTIGVFQLERLQDAAPSNAVVAPKPVQVLKPNQITPPPAGDPRYTNRRLLVLFF